jgi:hypothetical protein
MEFRDSMFWERPTDNSGTVVFDWLPQNFAGAMQFAGGAIPGQRLTPPHRLDLEDQLVLHAAHPVDELVVRYLPDVQISGHVFQPDGKPADGIRVEAQEYGWATPYQRTKTKPDGSYELDLSALPKATVIAVVSDDLVAPHQVVKFDNRNIIEGVDFHLVEGTIIRGTVTEGPDRIPVAKQPLGLVSDLPNQDEGAPVSKDEYVQPIARLAYHLATSTDDKGQFQLRAPPGKYRLRIRSDLKDGSDPHSCDLEITDQKEIVQDFNLPLVPTLKLRGRIVDADGQPIPNQAVQTYCISELDHGSRGFRTKTAENGAFEGERSRAWYVATFSQREDQRGGAALIGPDQDNVVIQMLPMVQVHGRIVHQSGAPVEEGTLICAIQGPTDFNALAIGTTAAPGGDGSYTIKSLAPGIELGIYYQPDRKTRPKLIRIFTAKPGQNLDLGDTPLLKPTTKLESGGR